MTDIFTTGPLHPIRQALIVIGAYLVAEIFLVACAFLWVFIYSLVIYPGGENAHYEGYAQVSSPVVAVVLAGPVFFAIGRFMRRRWDQALKLAMATGLVNVLVAVLLVMTSDMEDLTYQVSMMVLATIAMLTGAYIGARAENR